MGLRHWLKLRSSPYIYAVEVETPLWINDVSLRYLWGVFSSEKKAEEAIKAWASKGELVHPVVRAILVDYRTLTAPAKYWRTDDRKERRQSDHPS